MKNLILLNGTKTLSEKEQQHIKGGTTYEEAMGHCIINGQKILVKCNSVCPDGMPPFCFAWDEENPR